MNTSELLLPVAAQNHQHQNRHARTVHNKSSSSLRKKSDVIAMSKVRWNFLRNILANLQEIFLGTKLFLLFPFIPLAIIANLFNFGSVWKIPFFFFLSLLSFILLINHGCFLLLFRHGCSCSVWSDSSPWRSAWVSSPSEYINTPVNFYFTLAFSSSFLFLF